MDEDQQIRAAALTAAAILFPKLSPPGPVIKKAKEFENYIKHGTA